MTRHCRNLFLGLVLTAALPGFAALGAEIDPPQAPTPATEKQPEQKPLLAGDAATTPGPAPGGYWPWCSGFSVGIRTWLSWGDSERNHGANLGPGIGFVDVASDLKWRNMVSEAVELSLSGRIFERVIWGTEVGVGAISGGQFRDQDFASSGRQDLFSDTLSPAMNLDLCYVSANVGWRFCDQVAVVPDVLVTFDGLIGYQFWREKYVAEGGAVVVGVPVPIPAGPFITEQFTWQGFRIGGQCISQFAPRWALKTRVLLMPLTHFENIDIHHLRTDLLQDPSVIDRAAGGFGVMADVRFCYLLSDWAFLEIGYRVWNATSGVGETEFRFSDGTAAQVPFNQGETTRQGLTVGLSLQF